MMLLLPLVEAEIYSDTNKFGALSNNLGPIIEGGSSTYSSRGGTGGGGIIVGGRNQRCSLDKYKAIVSSIVSDEEDLELDVPVNIALGNREKKR